ncbi:hypothetical protein niasHS_015581 [Heterodera schachtii]|uniref:Uncharacterized protein n=1 Tax=Heterodera schachtii TaxID=97005 RepID=A0ABD2HRT8_HETSC
MQLWQSNVPIVVPPPLLVQQTVVPHFPAPVPLLPRSDALSNVAAALNSNTQFGPIPHRDLPHGQSADGVAVANSSPATAAISTKNAIDLCPTIRQHMDGRKQSLHYAKTSACSEDDGEEKKKE